MKFTTRKNATPLELAQVRKHIIEAQQAMLAASKVMSAVDKEPALTAISSKKLGMIQEKLLFAQVTLEEELAKREAYLRKLLGIDNQTTT